jgi:hypothetical protein
MRSEEIAPDAVTDNDPFTFEAFIKSDPNSRGGGLLQFGPLGGFSRKDVGLNVLGMYRAYREKKPQISHQAIATGWQHMVFVYEGRRKPSHVYINGKQVSWNYFSAWYVPMMQKMMIGKGFTGDIAHLRMWRGIKSEKEIGEMAEAALAKQVTK